MAVTPEDDNQLPTDTNQPVAQQAVQQLTPEQQAWLQQMVDLQQRQQQAQMLSGSRVNNDGRLPVASIVYGCAASALLVVAISSMINGSWINGILILLPTFILMGYAMHFLKNG